MPNTEDKLVVTREMDEVAWIELIPTYEYDSTNGIRYYFICIADLSDVKDSSSSIILDVLAKGNFNEPVGLYCKIFISCYYDGNHTISVGIPGQNCVRAKGVHTKLAAYLDSNWKVWISVSNIIWNSRLRIRKLYNSNSGIKYGLLQKTLTKPSTLIGGISIGGQRYKLEDKSLIDMYSNLRSDSMESSNYYNLELNSCFGFKDENNHNYPRIHSSYDGIELS